MHASRTIVVGIDGTTSDAAVAWAAAHASRTGAHVHLVHSTESTATVGESAAGEDPLAAAAARARALGTGSCTTAHIGTPAGPALLAAAEEAAMIVLGSRGAGARLGLPDSSVGGHVARFARCPVAIVPDLPAPATGVLELDLRTGDRITAAVEFALAYAAAHHLKIRTSRPAPVATTPTRSRVGVSTLEREWENAQIVVLPALEPGTSPWAARGHLTEVAVRHARCPVVFAR